MAIQGQNNLEPVTGGANPRADFRPDQWSIGDLMPWLPDLGKLSIGAAWGNAENLDAHEPGTTYNPQWTTGSRDNTGASWNEQMVPQTEALLRQYGMDPASSEGQYFLNRIHGDPRMSTDEAFQRRHEMESELQQQSYIRKTRESGQGIVDKAKAYYTDRADRFGKINKAPGQAREGMLRSDSELGGQLSQAEEAINSELSRQRLDTSEGMASRGLGASGKAIDRDRLQSQQAAYLKGQNVSNALQYASGEEGSAVDKLTGLAGVESDLASSDLGRVMSAYQGLNTNLRSNPYSEPYNMLSANLGRNDINDAKAMEMINLFVNALMSAQSQGSDMMNSVMGMVGKGGG